MKTGWWRKRKRRAYRHPVGIVVTFWWMSRHTWLVTSCLPRRWSVFLRRFCCAAAFLRWWMRWSRFTSPWFEEWVYLVGNEWDYGENRPPSPHHRSTASISRLPTVSQRTLTVCRPYCNSDSDGNTCFGMSLTDTVINRTPGPTAWRLSYSASMHQEEWAYCM